MHAGGKSMFLHSEDSEDTTHEELCTVLHNKESWLFRDMQNLFSLCFRKNYI